MDSGKLDGKLVGVSRDSQDLIGRGRHKHVRFHKGEWKWAQLKQSEKRVQGSHRDVENQVDVIAIVKIRHLKLQKDGGEVADGDAT